MFSLKKKVSNSFNSNQQTLIKFLRKKYVYYVPFKVVFQIFYKN